MTISFNSLLTHIQIWLLQILGFIKAKIALQKCDEVVDGDPEKAPCRRFLKSVRDVGTKEVFLRGESTIAFR